MTVRSFHLLRLGVFGNSPCKSCVLTVFHHAFKIAPCAFQCAEVVILVALVTGVTKATTQKLTGRMKILKLYPRILQISPALYSPAFQTEPCSDLRDWNRTGGLHTLSTWATHVLESTRKNAQSLPGAQWSGDSWPWEAVWSNSCDSMWLHSIGPKCIAVLPSYNDSHNQDT